MHAYIHPRSFAHTSPAPLFFHLADCGGPAAIAPAFATFPDHCRHSTKNLNLIGGRAANYERPTFRFYFSSRHRSALSTTKTGSDNCRQAVRYGLSITASFAKCPQKATILLSFSVGIPVSPSYFACPV